MKTRLEYFESNNDVDIIKKFYTRIKDNIDYHFDGGLNIKKQTLYDLDYELIIKEVMYFINDALEDINKFSVKKKKLFSFFENRWRDEKHYGPNKQYYLDHAKKYKTMIYKFSLKLNNFRQSTEDSNILSLIDRLMVKNKTLIDLLNRYISI